MVCVTSARNDDSAAGSWRLSAVNPWPEDGVVGDVREMLCSSKELARQAVQCCAGGAVGRGGLGLCLRTGWINCRAFSSSAPAFYCRAQTKMPGPERGFRLCGTVVLASCAEVKKLKRASVSS